MRPRMRPAPRAVPVRYIYIYICTRAGYIIVYIYAHIYAHIYAPCARSSSMLCQLATQLALDLRMYTLLIYIKQKTKINPMHMHAYVYVSAIYNAYMCRNGTEKPQKWDMQFLFTVSVDFNTSAVIVRDHHSRGGIAHAHLIGIECICILCRSLNACI